METLETIALKKVRYSDSHSILTAFSRQRGTVSLLVTDGSSRGAARNRALLLPMSVAECVADCRPGREIWPIRSLRPLLPLTSLRTDPLKNMIATFLAETCSLLLRQSQPDESLFDYIRSSIQELDNICESEAAANFHLCFLYGLGRMLGVEPDVSTYTPGCVFDLHDGIFKTSTPLHSQWLGTDEAKGLWMISRMSYANMSRYRLSRRERNRSLDLMLSYFTTHLTPTASLKSLDVFRALLD